MIFNSYLPKGDVVKSRVESKRWNHSQSSSVDLCFHGKYPTEDVDCRIGCLLEYSLYLYVASQSTLSLSMLVVFVLIASSLYSTLGDT